MQLLPNLQFRLWNLGFVIVINVPIQKKKQGLPTGRLATWGNPIFILVIHYCRLRVEQFQLVQWFSKDMLSNVNLCRE
jgi:hypothetical protein